MLEVSLSSYINKGVFTLEAEFRREKSATENLFKPKISREQAVTSDPRSFHRYIQRSKAVGYYGNDRDKDEIFLNPHSS